MNDILIAIIISSVVVGILLFILNYKTQKQKKAIYASNCPSCNQPCMVNKNLFSGLFEEPSTTKKHPLMEFVYQLTCQSCKEEFKVSDDGWLLNDHFSNKEKKPVI